MKISLVIVCCKSKTAQYALYTFNKMQENQYLNGMFVEIQQIRLFRQRKQY